LAGSYHGDLLMGVASTPRHHGTGIVCALLPEGKLLTGGLALQPSKAALLARSEQAAHVEHLACGKGHGVDHASVDPNRRLGVRGRGENRYLDPKADVPPERVLDQAGAGDSPRHE